MQPDVTNVTGEAPLRTHMDKVGAIYYFRRVVPKQLRRYFKVATDKARNEFKIPQKTKDRKEAIRKLELLAVEITA